MKIKKIFSKLHTPSWLFILLSLLLILRIPSFFEPYSYGDEMIYLALGEAVREGIPLYKNIHDNKPPLLYLIAAISGSLFWFKAILSVWHLATVFIFWKLSEALFPKKLRLQKVSTIVFGLATTLPLLEGNIANAELFLVGPTMAAFLILLTKKLTPKNLVISGLFLSVATLFKVPAAFDLFAIIFYWIVIVKRSLKNYKAIAKNTLLLLSGFALPILITLIWYFIRGAFFEYLVAAFLQNVGYLSSFRPGDVQKPFLVKNAPLLTRGGITFVALAILYWKRKRLSKQFIFITAWLLMTLFAVTLSERPYPHYLIQSIPSISLLLGILLTQQNVEQVLSIFPLTLAFFVPHFYGFWYYPTTPYYTRFVKLASGNISKQQYLDSFGGHVRRNYDIANYLVSSTKRKEKVFIWGDGVAIYAIAHRLPPIKYVADYHISDFSTPNETIDGIRKDMPAFIVVLPDAPEFHALSKIIINNYGLVETIDGATIWKLLSPNVRALLSS